MGKNGRGRSMVGRSRIRHRGRKRSSDDTGTQFLQSRVALKRMMIEKAGGRSSLRETSP